MKAELVVRYRSGLAPRQVSIDDICFGKYFYSDLEDATLDDKITEQERTMFGPALDAVRKNKDVDGSVLRKFISHLMLRTQTARYTIDAMANAAGRGLVAAVTDQEVVARMLRSGAVDSRKMSKRAIDEKLAELGKSLPRRERLRIRKRAEAYLKADVDRAAKFVADTATQALPAAFEQRLSGERIQKDVLARDISLSGRMDKLSQMTLSIFDVDAKEQLILGDDPVVAFSADGRVTRAFIPASDPHAYVLPVTPTRAIALHIGGIGDLARPALLNDASAALSREQFISRVPPADSTRLLNLLNTYRDSFEDINWKSVASGQTFAE